MASVLVPSSQQCVLPKTCTVVKNRVNFTRWRKALEGEDKFQDGKNTAAQRTEVFLIFDFLISCFYTSERWAEGVQAGREE